LPIIFITGYGDIPMSVRAMKAGAVEFLTKPFRDQDLLDAVGVALERDRDRAASPPNLIREMSRFDDSSDPPNLQRLSTRQAIEERGIDEIHERFVDAGVVARMSR